MKFSTKMMCVGLVLWSASLTGWGFVFAPTHSCREPYKPFGFSSKWELEQFQRDVIEYKQCLIDFAEEQYNGAQTYKESGDDAIDEWNEFARRLQ